MSFDANSRTISGVTSASGVSTVTITATDPGGLSASTMFTITVNPAPVVNPPTPGSFAITGVTTVSCAVVTAGERRLTFTPQYSGTSTQPISFSVVNEMLPTMASGPYTLRMYIDNPTITLKATQQGTAGEASFTYNWLAACGNANTRKGAEPMAALQIRVLGNPVQNIVEVEVTGAQGTALNLSLTDMQSRIVGQIRSEASGAAERYRFNVSAQADGVFLLRVSSNGQTKTVRILKVN